jgi:hypothetical protein
MTNTASTPPPTRQNALDMCAGGWPMRCAGTLFPTVARTWFPDLGPERTSPMLQSHIIDIDGAFVGAAVRLDRGYRFIATDMKLEELDGSIWPTLADVQRLARRIYLGGRLTRPVQAS